MKGNPNCKDCNGTGVIKIRKPASAWGPPQTISKPCTNNPK